MKVPCQLRTKPPTETRAKKRGKVALFRALERPLPLGDDEACRHIVKSVPYSEGTHVHR
jgi:hypothetical protein